MPDLLGSFNMTDGTSFQVRRVQIISAIKPWNIFCDNAGQPLLGTLGSHEFELEAAFFVHFSKERGFWTGCLFTERAQVRSVYAQMMDKGLLSETKVSEGWLYQLTPLAISQIYVVQSEATIMSLQTQLRRAQGESLLKRIKRHLREMFAPASAST